MIRDTVGNVVRGDVIQKKVKHFHVALFQTLGKVVLLTNMLTL